MIKIMFAMNILVIITALLFFIMGIKYFKNDKYNKRCMKCILGGTSITGICIIIGALLFVPTFFPI
ncbi:hypothetical protein LGL55_08605 [Clostridium tagluense]|uniref:Uncharacterized protein n=1 Tax=Clostridium tagluense TaxID=360422 RepID=A0A401UIM4_9CLOT|nr:MULTISPECIES: hypothetical protein [Clostridium]MBU3129092.1 hypothetical protein [Clostridium tagluense]MBW9156171.1 hypothetical protein [Clostridium tagluense]MBZ9625849.1 hypothetical protein [Clostridium sp. FP2]MBZ9637254.1 hypothetical protein [Clostridium sp. FP1]MCB2297970.1 hypothetical protein [Clostridium tagluense]